LVNKNFKILIIFIEINVNVCLLPRQHVMTSIILHTRRPVCQSKVGYALGFYVSVNFLFSHFEVLKSTFFTSLNFTPRGLYYRVSGTWMSVIVQGTEIK